MPLCIWVLNSAQYDTYSCWQLKLVLCFTAKDQMVWAALGNVLLQTSSHSEVKVVL